MWAWFTFGLVSGGAEAGAERGTAATFVASTTSVGVDSAVAYVSTKKWKYKTSEKREDDGSLPSNNKTHFQLISRWRCARCAGWARWARCARCWYFIASKTEVGGPEETRKEK